MPQFRARFTDVDTNEATGWARISTDGRPGTLQTQHVGKIREAEAFAASGELLEITYVEQEGRNVNPHTNKPYINRYFEAATVVTNGASPPSNSGGGGEDRGYGWRTHPDDAWRICLSVGWERAIELSALEDPPTVDIERLWHMAYGIATKVYATPRPGSQPAEAIGFGDSPAGARSGYSEPEAPADTPAPYIDDDWPPRDQ